MSEAGLGSFSPLECPSLYGRTAFWLSVHWEALEFSPVWSHDVESEHWGLGGKFFFLCVCVCVVLLGMDPRALSMLGKHCTPELMLRASSAHRLPRSGGTGSQGCL